MTDFVSSGPRHQAIVGTVMDVFNLNPMINFIYDGKTVLNEHHLLKRSFFNFF